MRQGVITIERQPLIDNTKARKHKRCSEKITLKGSTNHACASMSRTVDSTDIDIDPIRVVSLLHINNTTTTHHYSLNNGTSVTLRVVVVLLLPLFKGEPGRGLNIAPFTPPAQSPQHPATSPGIPAPERLWPVRLRERCGSAEVCGASV